MLSKAMQDKLMSAEEAVRRFIPDGAQVVLGGFTVTRNPKALAWEMARQGRRTCMWSATHTDRPWIS